MAAPPTEKPIAKVLRFTMKVYILFMEIYSIGADLQSAKENLSSYKYIIWLKLFDRGLVFIYQTQLNLWPI